MKVSLVLGVLILTCSVQSARILGVFPLPGKSHYFLGSALMRALAEKGHDVTVISPFGEKTPPNGGTYRDIVLTGMLDDVETRRKEVNMFEMGDLHPFMSVPALAYLISEIGEMTLKHDKVQSLIKSGEKFDAVIIEQFYNDAHKVLSSQFGGVQILFSTIGSNFWVNGLVGNPAPVAYVPDTFLNYSPQMSFCERLTNSLVYGLNVLVHHQYLYPKHNKVVEKFIPNSADFYNALYNTSLVLLNSHPSLNQAVPHVPNMIEIGGFHVKPPTKLPQDLQTFLDNAQDGVIYFSMGSNLRSSDLPPAKREALLKNFAKLKQKVLWKWEEDVLSDQPPNVKLSKWFPQQDILAHPKVKLFITHGGLLSTIESVYHGVPILAIPIFGDQKLNAQVAVNGGYGLALPYRELNEKTLGEKLRELLNDFKYLENAKLKSGIFHDRLVSPLDTATYWVEYVIRHGGAKHLRVAALDLPWYQYYLLDVVAVVAAILTAFLVVFLVIVKKIWNKLRKKSDRKVKKQ